MHTLVVYESMYGNTHFVADAIARGLRATGEVRVVAVDQADGAAVLWADVLVVGGPTHIHGLTRPSTRHNATERAAAPDSGLTLDASAPGPGLREWLDALPKVHGKPAAAFDTRTTGPAFLTGAASGGIAGKLRGRGFKVAAKPESFLVDKDSRLVEGEADRAEAWAAALSGGLATAR